MTLYKVNEWDKSLVNDLQPEIAKLPAVITLNISAFEDIMRRLYPIRIVIDYKYL